MAPNITHSGDIKIQKSLLRRAVEDEQQALILMFKQFIPEDEQCYYLQYLGVEGFWWFGTHSFACLTDRRVASIMVGIFGEVIYQDAYLEFVNSGIIYQPSKLYLYIYTAFIAALPFSAFLFSLDLPWKLIVFLLLSGLASVLFPLAVRLYYRIFKCGLVFWVREGIPVYIFSNRRFLKRANLLFRNTTLCRENRLKFLKN